MAFECSPPVDLENPVDPKFPPPDSWKRIDNSDYRRESSDLRECCKWEGEELTRIVSNLDVSIETLLLVSNNHSRFLGGNPTSPSYAPVWLAQEKILETPNVSKKEILKLACKGLNLHIREKAEGMIATCLAD